MQQTTLAVLVGMKCLHNPPAPLGSQVQPDEWTCHGGFPETPQGDHETEATSPLLTVDQGTTKNLSQFARVKVRKKRLSSLSSLFIFVQANPPNLSPCFLLLHHTDAAFTVWRAEEEYGSL